MDKPTLLAILALLLGIVNPLLMWPGPLFLRHLAPGIASAILMILACLGSMERGSKTVGIIFKIILILGCKTLRAARE